MYRLPCFTIFYVLVASFPIIDGMTNDPDIESWETQLILDLTLDYNKNAPAVSRESGRKQVVNLDIGILGIDDLNIKDNTFTATFIFVQSWDDQRLKFNSSRYDGLKQVVLPMNMVWIPDIVPWNTPPSDSHVSIYGDTVMSFSDGTVYSVQIKTFRTQCSLDVTHFPNDVQTCVTWLGSWNYGSDQMTLTLGKDKTREMVIRLDANDSMHPVYDHPEFELVDNLARVKVETKSMPYGNWEILTIKASIRRRGCLYHSMASGLGVFIGAVIPLVFLIDYGTPERTTIGLLIILGFTLLVMVIQNVVPLDHNTVPKVGRYYICSIVLSSMCVILSVILSRLRLRDTTTNPVPAWLKKLFLIPGVLRPYLLLVDYVQPDAPYISGINSVTKPDPEKESDSEANVLLDELRMYARYMAGRVMKEETMAVSTSEWTEVVRVFDRILFILFFFLFLVTSFAFLV